MSKLYYNLCRKDPEAYARTVKWLKDFGDRRAATARAAKKTECPKVEDGLDRGAGI